MRLEAMGPALRRCGVCLAAGGEWCRRPDGRYRYRMHRTRFHPHERGRWRMVHLLEIVAHPRRSLAPSAYLAS